MCWTTGARPVWKSYSWFVSLVLAREAVLAGQVEIFVLSFHPSYRPPNDTFSSECHLKEKVEIPETEVPLGTESEIQALPLPRCSMPTRSGFLSVPPRETNMGLCLILYPSYLWNWHKPTHKTETLARLLHGRSPA